MENRKFQNGDTVLHKDNHNTHYVVQDNYYGVNSAGRWVFVRSLDGKSDVFHEDEMIFVEKEKQQNIMENPTKEFLHNGLKKSDVVTLKGVKDCVFCIMSDIRSDLFFDCMNLDTKECKALHWSALEKINTPKKKISKQESIFTDNPKTRKSIPVYSGFIKYFPRAIAAVANLSYIGNQQHHPDKPLFWDKPKSSDHADAMMRHLIDDVVGKQRGEEMGDTEENPFASVREKVAVAWRAMAELEIELERKEKEGK